MKLSRILALSWKELLQIRRDPSTFLIAFVMPMLLLFIFGFGVSLDSANTRVALVVQDDSPPARSLALAYYNSPYFDVTMAQTMAPVRDLMIDGTARGIIVIPEGFGAGVKSGNIPDVQVITDGAQPNVAHFIAGYAEGIRGNWMQQELGAIVPTDPPVAVSPRYWYNPGLHSRFMLVPGAIAIVMTMIGTLLTALVVAREWERGTMEAIMATPVRMGEFIASKIVPYFVLAIASMALCTVVAMLMFQVPFRGSWFALVVISAAFLMPSLGLGLFISSATKNQFVASQMALLTSFLPTMMLSGFLFEISAMPVPIQALTYLVPARYFIPCLQSVFMAGDIWGLFLPNIAIMLVFGAVFFLLSFRVTRRSLD